jgi:hypothetical protein
MEAAPGFNKHTKEAQNHAQLTIIPALGVCSNTCHMKYRAALRADLAGSSVLTTIRNGIVLHRKLVHPRDADRKKCCSQV